MLYICYICGIHMVYLQRGCLCGRSGSNLVLELRLLTHVTANGGHSIGAGIKSTGQSHREQHQLLSFVHVIQNVTNSFVADQ